MIIFISFKQDELYPKLINKNGLRWLYVSFLSTIRHSLGQLYDIFLIYILA